MVRVGGKVGLVHLAETGGKVCEKEATRKVDVLVSRGKGYGQPI